MFSAITLVLKSKRTDIICIKDSLFLATSIKVDEPQLGSFSKFLSNSYLSLVGDHPVSTLVNFFAYKVLAVIDGLLNIKSDI